VACCGQQRHRSKNLRFADHPVSSMAPLVGAVAYVAL
jgi:hypothetical protein